MKIGIFTECYKPIINGVVNSIDGFKKGLTELDHEVIIFSPNYKDKTPEKNVIYCKSKPIPGNSGYHFIEKLDIRKFNIASHLNIIHTQHPFIMASRALEVAKKYNIPLVFTNHTQYEQYAHYVPIGKNIVRYFIRKWVTNFVNKCDLVIAPAEGIKNKLMEYKVKTEIVVVPNGIDLDKFKDRNKNYLKEKFKLKNWPICIFVGRIAEEKNLIFLIDAFKKVLITKPETYLILVGGGPELDNYNSYIKENKLENNIIITGFLPYGEIPDCLASAQLFVSTSTSEVHPLTVLEAMASGLPSVVFDTSGTGEIIDNNITGIKTKTNNMDEYQNSIIKLLDDKNLVNKIGKNALNYSKKYSFIETSKQMLRAYNKAIEFHKEKSKILK